MSKRSKRPHIPLLTSIEFNDDEGMSSDEDENVHGTDEHDDKRTRFPNAPLSTLNINWQSAINTMKVGNKIADGGVFDAEAGTVIAADQKLTTVTPQEIQYIASLHAIQNADGQQPPTLGGVSHHIISFNNRCLVGVGFISVRTRRTILLGTYALPQNAVLGNQLMDKLGTEFVEQGL
jgi:hypothetical protein